MALGRASLVPTSAHARLKGLSSIAFMGLPCPTNSAGVLSSRLSRFAMACLAAASPVIPRAPIESAVSTVRRFICVRSFPSHDATW